MNTTLKVTVNTTILKTDSVPKKPSWHDCGYFMATENSAFSMPFK